MKRATGFWLGTMLACAGCALAEPQPDRNPQAAAAEAKTDEAPAQAARFRATVFEVRLPNERIPDLDAKQLAGQGGTAAALLQTLGKFGATRTLFHVDQTTDLRGNDEALIGAQFPTQKPNVVGNPPIVNSTFEWLSSGATFNMKGHWSAPGPNPRLHIEIAEKLRVPMEVESKLGDDLHASQALYREVNQKFAGTVRAGRPIVMIGAEGLTPDKDGKAVAYVTRIELMPTEQEQ